MFSKLRCLLFGHSEVVIDADMAGVAYFCTGCRKWLDPGFKYSYTRTYQEWWDSVYETSKS